MSEHPISSRESFIAAEVTHVDTDPHDLFSSISPEDLAMPTFHSEPVWRSATLIAPAPAPDLFGSHLDQPFETVTRPRLKRDKSPLNSKDRVLCQNLPVILSDPYIISANSVDAPEVPFLLMPTHFSVSTSLPVTESKINEFLKETNGVSFEAVKSNYEWNCVYLSGSTHCKAQFHIYSNSREYIVEGNKLMGDSALFRSLYSQLKSSVLALNATETFNEYDSFAVFTPLPTPPALLVDCADSQGLGPILRMAQQPFMEAQVEAARSLCDLSVEVELRPQMCEMGCVEVLRDLIAHSSSEWAQQHAIACIANLSEVPACHGSIIASGVVSVLLSLAVDGPYQSAELRRLAVFIIANLSANVAQHLVNALGPREVSGWVNTVDSLVDERLRIHAIRARENFQLVLVQ